MLDLIEELPQTEIAIDLARQTVELPRIGGAQNSWTFDIDPFRKQCLIRGLDDLGICWIKRSRSAPLKPRRHFDICSFLVAYCKKADAC